MEFNKAIKELDVEAFIAEASNGKIELPERIEDVIELVFRIAEMKSKDKINLVNGNYFRVSNSIKMRLSEKSGEKTNWWRYKSDILNQLRRRQFFLDLCDSNKCTPKELLNASLRSMVGEIEYSKNGKQMRLKSKADNTSHFTADCPDMDF